MDALPFDAKAERNVWKMKLAYHQRRLARRNLYEAPCVIRYSRAWRELQSRSSYSARCRYRMWPFPLQSSDKKMRLTRTESVLIAVALCAVVSFSGFLQGEMNRAARERNRHDIGTIVDAACANLNAADLDSSDNGRLQCGEVGHEAAPASGALTASVNGASTVPNP
jgi:hypothetical protein